MCTLAIAGRPQPPSHTQTVQICTNRIEGRLGSVGKLTTGQGATPFLRSMRMRVCRGSK
jgi:hypothetical protein